MFIRIKKVKKRNGKEYEYAHLVQGIWKRKRLKENEGKRYFKKFNNSLHKYKRFIGRVYKFENKNIDFEEFLGSNFEEFVNKCSVSDIYKKLLEYELIRRGFKKRKEIYSRDNLFVDLNRLIVHDGKSDVVIKLRDVGGYLCSLNLDELFNIKKISNKYEGLYLLKRLRMAGIKLDADQFYILAEKMLES